jgi:predicted DNA-binding transcriptional regulator AlpA
MHTYPHRLITRSGHGRRCVLAKIVSERTAPSTAWPERTSTRECMTRTPANTKPAQTLDLEAVAHMLRCSVRHLHDLRQDDPTFPIPRMLGTSPRWTYETIHTWVELPSRTAATTPTADPATEASAPAPAPAPARARARTKGAARVH